MFYRSFPKPRPIKFYGFERVERNKEIEIIERLQRPTQSILLSGESGWREDYNQQLTNGRESAVSASYGVHRRRTPKNCPRARAACCATPSESGCYIDHLRLEENQIERIFRRLQRQHTLSSSLRIRENSRSNFLPGFDPTDGERPTSSSRKSEQAPEQSEPAVNNRNNNNTCGNRRIGIGDGDDVQTILNEYERKQQLSMTLGRLRRPTTASSMKQLGQCAFCSQSHNLKARWSSVGTDCRQCGRMRQSVETINSHLEEQERRTRRLQQPTKSSQGGTPFCEKVVPAIRASGISVEAVGDTNSGESQDTPLISGLVKTKKVRDITSRLSRPKSGYY